MYLFLSYDQDLCSLRESENLANLLYYPMGVMQNLDISVYISFPSAFRSIPQSLFITVVLCNPAIIFCILNENTLNLVFLWDSNIKCHLTFSFSELSFKFVILDHRMTKAHHSAFQGQVL